MKPEPSLDQHIALVARQLQARHTALVHSTAALKAQAWRCSTAPAVVASAIAMASLLVWMRWRK